MLGAAARALIALEDREKHLAVTFELLVERTVLLYCVKGRIETLISTYQCEILSIEGFLYFFGIFLAFPLQFSKFFNKQLHFL